MTVQTRKYRNTARNAFLALVAVLAILGANLAISGPGRAAHAAPLTPAVQQHAQLPSVGIKLVKRNLTAAQLAQWAAQYKAQDAANLAQIRKLHPLYNYCDQTTWLTEAYSGWESFGGSGYSYSGTFRAGLDLLRDAYTLTHWCSWAYAWGNFNLTGGCAHFGGYIFATYYDAQVDPSAYGPIYHCTHTNYYLGGPSVTGDYCPLGWQIYGVSAIEESHYWWANSFDYGDGSGGGQYPGSEFSCPPA